MGVGHVILMTSLLALSAAQQPAVRLVSTSGSPSNEGRLEVYHNGQWGTVCDHAFDDVAATVACRQLNISDAGASLGNRHGPGNGTIWLDDVQCEGTEASLDGCQHNGWGSHVHCQHSDDVSIACYVANAVRLVGSEEKIGRLEIFHNATWGTVCDDYFYTAAAKVACFSLGFGYVGQRLYTYGSSPYNRPYSTGPIWMHNVRCFGNETSLVNCSHSGWGVHDCTHSEDVVLSCIMPVRLVGGNEHQGRLEVYHSGTWGTVCDHDFDDLSASVVCHELGFQYGGRTLGNMYGPGTGTIWLDDVVCFGHETGLAQCRHRYWGSNNCQHSNDVSIVCENTTYTYDNGTLRLEGSEVTYEGRLEIYHRGVWGTVCSHGFDNRDARVACRELGLGEYGHSISNYYGPGSGRVWLHGLRCFGNESTLTDCYHSTWGQGAYHCSHSYDVSISCSNTTRVANTTNVRLVGGSSLREGRLEVYHYGQWGTVCDDSFDDTDARVACFSLGFGYVGVTLQNQYGPANSSTRIWLDEVECIGYESSIAECQHNPWGYHNCGHREDVSISCNTLDDSYNGTRVRLVGTGSTETEGRLEVYHSGVWGTVCDDIFDAVDASVVCNELGFGRIGWPTQNTYGRGSGRIWLDDLSCRGTEQFIGDCHHLGWGRHNCMHYEDVAVVCHNVSEHDLRLVSGTPGEGRLEIFHNGSWGTVCNDAFDDIDAQVACFSLGFGRVGQTLHRKYSVYTYSMPSYTRIWLDGVQCTGSESNIADCRHRGWGVHDCNHQDDVSIACYDNTTVSPPAESTTAAHQHVISTLPRSKVVLSTTTTSTTTMTTAHGKVGKSTTTKRMTTTTTAHGNASTTTFSTSPQSSNTSDAVKSQC